MTDRITLPLVAYTALAAQLDEAIAEHARHRKTLEATATWQKVCAAADEVNRLQAQLDRFAPEEPPVNAPGTNGETWANDTARAAERAGPPSPRATDDTLGDLPECLDVTKRENSP